MYIFFALFILVGFAVVFIFKNYSTKQKQDNNSPIKDDIHQKQMNEKKNKKQQFIDQMDFQSQENTALKRQDLDKTLSSESLADQITYLYENNLLDIIKVNTISEKYLKQEQTTEVKEILMFIVRKTPGSLSSPQLFEALQYLKPNIYTYSLIFKTMHVDIKKNKNENIHSKIEDQYISEANQLWYDLIRLSEEFLPNIIVLNQYIQIYLSANQNSNALQIYQECISKYKLVPDRISLVNLERISYKFTQSLIQFSKKSNTNSYEIQRIIQKTNDINRIFLEATQFNDFDVRKEKYENLYKQLIELNIQRFDLEEVIKISQILYTKFGLSKINQIKRAFTYFYQNLLTSQGQISKILNVYAENKNLTLQTYLERCFDAIIDDLVQDDLTSEPVGEGSFIQLVRIYSEQLQILFRYNSVSGILALFIKQLQSIPEIQMAKQCFLNKNKLEQQAKISYPDIHTICLVVKCLIRDKAPGQALRATQFFKDNCVSGRGEVNQMEVPDSSYKEDHGDVLREMNKVKSLISYEINTFFLNGVIIELNSRHLYQHAIRFFQWMDRNELLVHRPNTSTYNMIILVYGSMQDFTKSKQIFEKMQDQWNALNNNQDNIEQYEKIYLDAIAPKNRSRTSSSAGQLQKTEFSESDDDQFARSNSQRDNQSSPQQELPQFKHASDAIQKHFNLKFPPTNINSYISLVNILNRQKLYTQIIDLLVQAKQAQDKAVHPLLTEDLNDFGPLYQSIVKNLLFQKRDDIRLKACQIAVESIETKQIFKETQLYKDCQTYLDQELKKKKNPIIALLEEKLTNLIDENDIGYDRDDAPRKGSNPFKKVLSNDNFQRNGYNKKGYTSDSRSYRRDEMSSNSGMDFDTDDHNPTPKKWAQKTSYMISMTKNQKRNSIEEMQEEESPQKVSQRNNRVQINESQVHPNNTKAFKVE